MVKLTPPMGWNTWNTFGHDINEELIKQATDTVIEKGLDKLGYEYIVIDDCWQMRERDENGRLVPNPEKFPNGMKAVADYIHSRGLKFGIYSCAGTLTCERFPGSFEYEFIDAKTFAEWEVDFLKYDYCFKPEHENGAMLYRRMGTAIANCGRDILFSACSWGADLTHEWIRSTGANMWRSTGDIKDNWESVLSLINQQIDIDDNYQTHNSGVFPYGGINCFNDMDMLVVGMHGNGLVGLGGCTTEEYKTHFSTWAMLSSPLMIGCDIREMDDETLAILSNREVIAINQDPRACQAYLGMNPKQYLPVFIRLLDNGDLAVLMVNNTDYPADARFAGEQAGLSRVSGTNLYARDIWTGEEFKLQNRNLIQRLQPNACRFLRIKVVSA